jgi:hypothetical protein
MACDKWRMTHSQLTKIQYMLLRSGRLTDASKSVKLISEYCELYIEHGGSHL